LIYRSFFGHLQKYHYPEIDYNSTFFCFQEELFKLAVFQNGWVHFNYWFWVTIVLVLNYEMLANQIQMFMSPMSINHIFSRLLADQSSFVLLLNILLNYYLGSISSNCCFYIHVFSIQLSYLFTVAQISISQVFSILIL
jgi:hypothetical protein